MPQVSERMLREVLGATTCGELLASGAGLFALFTEREARSYTGLCLGLGGEEPPPPPAEGAPLQKGVSQERTFPPTKSEAELRRWCADLCGLLGGQLAEKRLQARTLTLKLKQARAWHARTCSPCTSAHARGASG